MRANAAPSSVVTTSVALLYDVIPTTWRSDAESKPFMGVAVMTAACAKKKLDSFPSEEKEMLSGVLMSLMLTTHLALLHEAAVELEETEGDSVALKVMVISVVSWVVPGRRGTPAMCVALSWKAFLMDVMFSCLPCDRPKNKQVRRRRSRIVLCSS